MKTFLINYRSEYYIQHLGIFLRNTGVTFISYRYCYITSWNNAIRFTIYLTSSNIYKH